MGECVKFELIAVIGLLRSWLDIGVDCGMDGGGEIGRWIGVRRACCAGTECSWKSRKKVGCD